MKYIAIKLISLYQATLSPDHGWFKARYPYGYCKFYPTCSEYTKQAIIHNGFLKGGIQGLVRIVKCNPFSQGGIDKVSNL